MSTENLHRQDAIKKLQEMVNKIDIGMLCTQLKESSFIHAVPMSKQEVDEEGNIWMLFSSDSDSYNNITDNDEVSLLYSDVSSYSFLSINGIATISRDPARIEKYWNKAVEAWFEGKDDERIRILQVTPIEAHYWDNKTNKLITFLKVAASAVSGKKMDIGREGNLNI